MLPNTFISNDRPHGFSPCLGIDILPLERITDIPGYLSHRASPIELRLHFFT